MYFPLYSDLADFLDRLLAPYGDTWALTGSSWSCGQRFEVGFKSVCGIRGGFNVGEDLRVEALIQIQGSFLSALGDDQRSLVAALHEVGTRFTRCDIALDDHDRRVKFRYLRSLAVRGSYRLLDSFRFHESRPGRSGLPVPTLYFGSPTSDKVLRFYDAEFMHGIPADRWELQLRGDYPATVIEDYLVDPSRLASYVVGAIDFGHSPTGHYRDFYRYAFWQSLIDEVAAGQPSRLRSRPLEPDIYRSMSWLKRQGGIVLGVLQQGFGPDKFHQWIDSTSTDSTARFHTYHLSQVDYLKNATNQ